MRELREHESSLTSYFGEHSQKLLCLRAHLVQIKDPIRELNS